MVMNATFLRSFAFLLLTGPGLLLTACGDDDDVSSDPGTTEPSDPGTTEPEPSGGATEVVFEIAVQGGFVPVESSVTSFPELTVLADGTAITPGAQIEIYPPPALPAVQAVTLTDEDLSAIVDEVNSSALFGTALDFGFPNVADAPNLDLTARVADEVFEVSIPSYGFTDDPALTDEQRANRAAADDLVAIVRDIVDAHADQAEIYTPPGYLLLVRPSDAALAGDLPQESIAWPLDEALLAADPVNLFACIEVSGEQATTFAAAATSANQLTPWTGADGEHQVLVRPWLPHEPGCDLFSMRPTG